MFLSWPIALKESSVEMSVYLMINGVTQEKVSQNHGHVELQYSVLESAEIKHSGRTNPVEVGLTMKEHQNQQGRGEQVELQPIGAEYGCS